MSAQEEKEEANSPIMTEEDGLAQVDLAGDVKEHNTAEEDIPWKTRMWEVLTTFSPLGFVAFGGPQAHIAILRDHLVVQRNWMDEDSFTELFAIGQVRLKNAFCWDPLFLI